MPRKMLAVRVFITVALDVTIRISSLVMQPFTSALLEKTSSPAPANRFRI
jgi:hypothetical protein